MVKKLLIALILLTAYLAPLMLPKGLTSPNSVVWANDDDVCSDSNGDNICDDNQDE